MTAVQNQKQQEIDWGGRSRATVDELANLVGRFAFYSCSGLCRQGAASAGYGWRADIYHLLRGHLLFYGWNAVGTGHIRR